MRPLRTFAITTVVLTALCVTASAQKKPVRKAPPKRPPVAVVVLPPLEVRVARDKVNDQLSLLNGFISKFGPIAVMLEDTQREIDAGKASSAAAKQMAGNKAKTVEAIQNIGIGLSTVESDFRMKTTLKKYLAAIEGISVLAAGSEDLALAGKFVAAKDPLRAVSQKLMDVLAAMPK